MGKKKSLYGIGGAMRSAHPPQIKPNITVRHKYRFVASAAASVVLTTKSLCRAFGYCCTTSTTASSVIAAARIISLELWSPPASQGAASTCTVQWVGAVSTTVNPGLSAVEASDTSVSPAYPAHIRTRPPVRSLAADWFIEGVSGTVGNLCTVNAPSGTILDIEAEIIFGDGGASSPASFVVAAGTAGLLFYAPADNDTAASGKFQPIGLSTL